ncbi:uncharacterized protein isoform X1 [Rhodnius prolixus]|uniref:uncharacterized protein isoform X1 n=2 Tax=Rhodnius prolixus TaxID=13249 RepID=UPI003D1887CC
MDKEYLEILLRTKKNDMQVTKIISLEYTPAVDKGENYMSTMLRYKLVVLLVSGETAVKHLIVKSLPKSENHCAFVKEFSYFKNEIYMYTTVLKNMETLMEEFQDKREIVWCELIDYEPYHKLIMQDLKDLHFRVLNRRETLDLQHSLFVMNALARFHAMSAILLKRNTLRPSEFEPFVFSKEKIVNFVIVACLKAMTKAVKLTWDEQWSFLPDLLNKAADNCYPILRELTKPDAGRFNVINHGDCWTNNILFQHIENTNLPSAVRFVDFQICHYNSFAWDVTFFIYSSIRPNIRRENYIQLLASYHKALCNTLKFYQYPESEIPSFRKCIDEMKAIKYFGAMVLLSVHAVTTATCDEPFDVDQNLKNDSEGGVKEEIFTDPNYRESIKDDIKDFIEEGYL